MHECRRVLLDLPDAVPHKDVHGGADALRDLEGKVLGLVPRTESVLQRRGLFAQRVELAVQSGECGGEALRARVRQLFG